MASETSHIFVVCLKLDLNAPQKLCQIYPRLPRTDLCIV